jgi:putative endonuclease
MLRCSFNNKTIGNDGENAAVRYIEESGYSVIDTNVRPLSGMRRGEIDIVAWYGDILCIIEVKTRSSRYFDVTDAITISKRRQLTRLAQAYVAKHKLATECRFDVVCIYNHNPNAAPLIELVPGAFDPVY